MTFKQFRQHIDGHALALLLADHLLDPLTALVRRQKSCSFGSLSSNVSAVDTQYSSIQYNSAFGGSAVDTNAFPSNGCSVYSGVTKCLTDAQIQTEIQSVIARRAGRRTARPVLHVHAEQ